MNSIERIMDANTNRVAEGLRILEDHARFILDGEILAEGVREMKHEVRKITDGASFIGSRDSEGDVGLKISQSDTGKRCRSGLDALVTANFNRVQEGLRSLEEHSKTLGRGEWSLRYEALRFKSYGLEKAFARRSRIPAALETKVYGITWADGNGSHVPSVEKMVAGGIKVIQYREKDEHAHRYDELMEIRSLTRAHGALLIINDDVGLALLTGADGVHLGQDDVDWKRLPLIREKLLVGISTHSLEEAQEAEAHGADYIGFGPVYATDSKANALEPRRLEELEKVIGGVGIPVVAIGGVTPMNARRLPFDGIAGFAMIGAIRDAEDMAEWMSLWK